MITKAFELRDDGTFIPLLCVDMNPANEGQRYLLRRCGYPCDGRPNILITRMQGDGTPATNDPYAWGDRTMATAHHWIIEHWHNLPDGSVVDVEYVLGERSRPKTSEAGR